MRARTKVMGIINVTPDSFSDGGDWVNPGRAIDHGRNLIAEGAEILDVGGESTRPGAARLDLDEELRRVLPVVRGLADAGAVVSVDTMRHEVALAAHDAGARIINDVSGGLADDRMLPLIADLGVRYVVMHWRAHSAMMQDAAQLDYDDVVADVRAELAARLSAATAAGVRDEQIIVDPGIGFSKTPQHNWELLRGLDSLSSLGFPVLVGVSRKSFLGLALGSPDTPRPARELDDATSAVTAYCAQRGIWAVRTHTVRQHHDTITVTGRLHQR